MTKPVRIQLSRAKGFNLQLASQALNALPAVVVSRPGRWGNPFKVTNNFVPGTRIGIRDVAVANAADAVVRYRTLIEERPDLAAQIRMTLKGKNLACWCKPGAPCHADFLLEFANS